MSMDWLKGLVGPMAQFSPTGQPVQGAPGGGPGYPQGYGAPPGAGGQPGYGGPNYGAPPAGGQAPPGAWGPPPGAWGAGAPAGGPGAADPYGASIPSATPGAYGAAPPGAVPDAYGASIPSAAAPSWNSLPPASGADARVAQLETRCEELRRDLESVALFAQTLLAVLEDRKVMSQQDFHEMRRKLDLMDGRLDDRIAKTT